MAMLHDNTLVDACLTSASATEKLPIGHARTIYNASKDNLTVATAALNSSFTTHTGYSSRSCVSGNPYDIFAYLAA